MDKLLILGATYHEVELIRRAQAKGIYVIAADSNKDWSKSPAKYVADEAWDISWSDIESLRDRSIESGVRGVLAGFSEFRVENMIRLCDELDLPCALTMEQLDLTRDKLKFKSLCLKYGIPVVPEYSYGDAMDFPVIIKPVDRAGSIGINVAHTQEEFEEYYKIAYDLSPSRSVVIEDFINDGIKVDVYYFVKDGKIALLGTSDTVMCKGTSGAPILQKAWTFPSVHESAYLETVDACVRDMCNGIGIRNGYMTMSAFYRKGQFYFFEAGFRLSGELSYNYYNHLSGIHYMDTLIDYSMGIDNSDVYEDCWTLDRDKKSIILNFFAQDGCINEITLPDLDGMELISDLYVKTGDNVSNPTTVFMKAAMFTILGQDERKLVDAAMAVNSAFRIIDTYGNDMVYEKVSREELSHDR